MRRRLYRLPAWGLFFVAFCLCFICKVTAGAPVITNLFMAPKLTIVSDLNFTNQIQFSTDPAHTNWIVLTNVLVTQSPYIFVDIAATNNERLYRVVELADPAAATNSTIGAPGTVASGASVTALVQAKDAAGNSILHGGDTVVISVQNGTGSATVGGTTDNGNGTYGASVTGILSGAIRITATVNGVACTNTAGVTVIPGPATKLVITSQPGSTSVGSLFNVNVSAEDDAGNVASSFTGSVQLSLHSSPNGGILSGTLTVTAQSGLAMFTHLSVNEVGSYTVQATASGLKIATGTPFDVGN
jgi:hypothetical protein